MRFSDFVTKASKWLDQPEVLAARLYTTAVQVAQQSSPRPESELAAAPFPGHDQLSDESGQPPART